MMKKTPKKGGAAAPLIDEALAEAAIALANPEITSEAQARALFSAMNLDCASWTLAQHWMQKMLPQVASYGEANVETRKRTRDDLNRILLAFDGFKNLQIGPRGLEIAPPLRGLTDQIEGACARALVPFLLPEGWPPDRIGKCKYRNCEKWFLRPPSQRGAVTNYCSPAHSATERVMAFRDRQRKLALSSKAKRVS